MLKSLALLCAYVLSLSSLQAHDLYLLPDFFRIQANVRLRVAFHNGDAFPESEVAPKPERLQQALLRSATGSSPVTGLQIQGKETTGTVHALGPGSLLLSVGTVPNLIELPPDKFLAYLKEEGLTQVVGWRMEHQETSKAGRERYTKFAKSLVVADKPDQFYRQPLGLRIEIIPLEDPYTLRAGSVLPVQILFRGEPAPGLQLEAAWAGRGATKVQVIGRTAADGRIAVPLVAAGKWRLHSLAMERCSDSAVADWESSWASLTFEVR